MKKKERNITNPYLEYRKAQFYIRAPKNQGEIEGWSKSGIPYLKTFRRFIMQEGYPCVGARAAVNGKTFALGIFERMDSIHAARELAYGLSEYLDDIKESPSNFRTYIAIFKDDDYDDEIAFEQGMWGLLNRLHGQDSQKNIWCPEVGRDPVENDFSFSFGQEAFFMVGMHPKSSRKARRFTYPAIAFNLHLQFENLRKKGRYENMKNAIRSNEIEFAGFINPMLNDFGKGLEAPQYSGREVPADWRCPFSYQPYNTREDG